MPADIRETLQTTLGSAYSLDRELGGGGMSRVFLAHEPALGRQVVVKVLHPELASGVSVDRFRREIQLAAQLQHPHIVPILGAGETDGLPYLTMPFVAGRSLRDRLREPNPLSIGEATNVLRDVARALAYAHGRGVIHRDIKPDNVLLAEGSATVTDFGVAKAVSASRGEAGGTLTGVGTSIGTPTYMAPEQASGDPDTDHRADIYSWGAMAFELLAGRPPFDHKATHRLLVAHMTETAEPVTDYRPDCPPQLADLIGQCLEKDPGLRPQSAAELLTVLDGIGTPSGGEHDALPAISLATRRTLLRALGVYAAAFIAVAILAQAAVVGIGLPTWVLPGALVMMALVLPVVLFTSFVHHGSRVARTMAQITAGGSVTANSTMTRIAVKASPHMSWRRTTWWGVAAVGVFVAAVVAYMTLRALGIGPAGSLAARGAIAASDRVLVAEFRAPASDSALGSVVSEAVRTNLAQSQFISVVRASEVAEALQRMQLPAATRIDLGVAREMAVREGVKAIVDGEVTPAGGGYILTLRLVSAVSPDPLATVRESAKDATELIPAMDRATRALRARLGESLKGINASPSLARVTTTSLPALRKFTEGFRANGIDQDYPRAIAAFEEAVRLDSGFAMAYRSGAVAYANAGLNPARAAEMREAAFRLRERLPELERALVEGAFYATGRFADRRRAAAAYERVLELEPDNWTAINALGLYHASRRQYALAESLYRRGQAIPGASAFVFSNLTPTLVNQGRIDDADEAWRMYAQRFPNAPGARLNRWTVLAARGQYDSVGALCRSLTASPSAQIRATAIGCAGALAGLNGRLREMDRLYGIADSVEAARGVEITSLGTVLDRVWVDIWFRGRAEEGVRIIDSALAATPISSLSRERQVAYRGAAELYALAGRPDRARRTFQQWLSVRSDTNEIRLNRVGDDQVLAEIALAEGRHVDAIRLLISSDTMYDGQPVPCSICMLPRLARAYDLAGQQDSAIAVYERYLASGYAFRLSSVDGAWLVGTYKRLGELYEARGDHERALDRYGRFVAMWRDADPDLQPRVAEVTRRMARLRDTERRPRRN